MTDRPFRLYGDSRSGNCYKLKLLCAEMDIGYEWREVDIDRDPALIRRYDVKVPVLCLGEREVCHHFFDESALLAALALA